jgi:hypothetical protein
MQVTYQKTEGNASYVITFQFRFVGIGKVVLSNHTPDNILSYHLLSAIKSG